MSKNITYLQLRAARQSLNIGVRELAKLLKVSKGVISKAEQNKTRDFFFKYNAALTDFFQKNNITFPNEYTIRFHSNDPLNIEEQKITRFQLKAARNILNISQLQLACNIKIDKGVISRAELLDNTSIINPSDQNVILKLYNYFSKCNIEFPDPLCIFFKKYVDNSLDN